MDELGTASEISPKIYRVFKVRETLALADPDMPQPRWHTVIFVETILGGDGFIHHVIGDLVTGMTYERKFSPRPELSSSFYSKEHLGNILVNSYPEDLEAVCCAQPPPPRQKAFNTKTMRYEPAKPDGSFYQPGEHRTPLRKCTEWIEDQIIPSLLGQGVLQRPSTLKFS